MTYECFELTLSRASPIRLIVLRANSMIPSFWTELPYAINELSRDASAQLLSCRQKNVAFGYGYFCLHRGGLDGPASGSRLSAPGLRHHCMALQDAFARLEEARMPVLVAIQGVVCVDSSLLVIVGTTRDAFSQCGNCDWQTHVPIHD